MADRQWFAGGVQVFETGEEEYFVNGIQLNENQAAATVPEFMAAINESRPHYVDNHEVEVIPY